MQKRYCKLFLIFLFASFLLSGCIGKRYEKTQTKEYRINTLNKTKIVVDNSSGTISVTKGDSLGEIQIIAEIKAKVKKKDLNKPLDEVIALQIDSSSEVINIKSESKTTFGIYFGKFSPQIDYRIIVPANLKVDIENINGNVSVKELANDINISVTNGRINCEHLSSEVNLSVVNGNINMILDSTKGVEIDAVNGGVELNLTEHFKGYLNANTVNGSVKIDNKFLFKTTSEANVNFARSNEDSINNHVEFSDKRSFKGYIGDKKSEVRIDVVNGKININKK